MLAGRDASYPLGAMALNDAALTKTDITGLTSRQVTTLFEWFTKLKQKYPIMGYLWPHETGMTLRDPELPGADDDDEEELPYIDQTTDKTTDKATDKTIDQTTGKTTETVDVGETEKTETKAEEEAVAEEAREETAGKTDATSEVDADVDVDATEDNTN